MEMQLEPEFWKKKKLEKLNKTEWEALCDHCGKCCLHKYTAENKCIFINSVCQHLMLPYCHCRIYDDRFSKNCVEVNLQLVEKEPELLPDSCAYKLLYLGKDLPDWHPLVTGNPYSALQSGNTVVGNFLISEKKLSEYINENGCLPPNVFPIEVVNID